MKKSDIYICGFMYAFSFFFLYLTQSFPLGARHYPHFVIGLLLILTSVRVGQMVRDYRREKTSENDMSVLFDGFMPKQFWTMFAAFILYFVMMYLVGFYPASLVYLLFCLKFFKIRPLYILLVLAGMVVLVFGTFDLFLNVPLPMGMLIEDLL